MGAVADGGMAYLAGFAAGIEPDPDLWIDEWSDEHMRIPRGAGAEHGKYRTSRTPYARAVMRYLSPGHPCRRVVAMVASQTMKTQVGINWLMGSIHVAPGNMLVLEPSLNLAKRVSGRIAKTIDEVEPVRERVAPVRSRDSRNTIDMKEFDGGTLYITTAGSAANLAEVPARYVYGDEVDRWDASVDGEGDPVKLAEARATTFGRNAKFYYSSSPTIEGASRIAALYEQSDQEHFEVPCPHCGEYQILEWENLWYADDCGRAAYVCQECGTQIEEQAKTAMLEAGRWVASAVGDGETIGVQLSALYSPLGWVSWAQLAKEYVAAKKALEKGDSEPMQVFYNTRLARVWDNVKERTRAEELRELAKKETFALRTVPDNVLVLTAAVDTQDNRLELQITGWGEGMERWVLDYQAIHGDPATNEPWEVLDEILKTPLRRDNGINMPIRAVAVDSGGHHTQDVYEFTRRRKYRMVFAVKGASKPGRPVVSGQPSKVDINHRGKIEKFGAELWMVGSDTAKDWLHSRWKLATGPGSIHFSPDLPDDYYDQVCSEQRLVRYVKGFRRTEWVKARGDRNEALDLNAYNLAAAHRLGLHKWRAADWERERIKVNPPQSDFFVAPVEAQKEPDAPEPAARPPQPDPEDAPRKKLFSKLA